MGKDADGNIVGLDEVEITDDDFTDLTSPKTTAPPEPKPKPGDPPADVPKDGEPKPDKLPAEPKPSDLPADLPKPGDPLVDVPSNGDPKKDDLPADKPIVIDGKNYSAAEISESLLGSMRLQDYTKKTMELADDRKSIQNVHDFLSMIKDKGAAVMEVIEDELGKDAAKAFEKMIDKDLWDNPFESELNTRQARIDELEGQMTLEKEAKDLKSTEKLSDKKVQEVLDFAIQKFDETGVAHSLSDAYRLMNYDDVQAKAAEAVKAAEDAKKDKDKPPKPEVPPLANKKTGSRDLNLKTNKSYEDISVDDFNNVIK